MASIPLGVMRPDGREPAQADSPTGTSRPYPRRNGAGENGHEELPAVPEARGDTENAVATE